MASMVSIELQKELRDTSDTEVLLPRDEESERTTISNFFHNLVLDALIRELGSLCSRFIPSIDNDEDDLRIRYRNERIQFIRQFPSKLPGLKAMEVQKLQLHQNQKLNSLGDAVIKSRNWYWAEEFEHMESDDDFPKDFVPPTLFDGCFTLLRLPARTYKTSKGLLTFEYNPNIHNLLYVDVMKSGGFATPGSRHIPANCGNIDTEIEEMLREAGALSAKDLRNHDNDRDAVYDFDIHDDAVYDFGGGCAEPSHNSINAIIKTKRVYLYGVLLLMASIVAKITYQTAFSVLGGTLRERYSYSYAENGTLQVKNRDSIVTGSFMLFNSTAFVASVAMIIFLLHEFPLKPWPQITVSTLFGSYMYLIMATSPREALSLLFLASPFLLLAAAGKLRGFARPGS
ncbi:uncharacterized protein LOC132270657 isoform X2 [Cornus florida]|uniref:uncharacterized protein LOC132270657 isoform X2 n=1 Tax=Cornus florida TaxID=4283 RepID=UPI00289A862C|nr:uncharacterized protein LOC132270657 isoform X2 [Cornus florida]